MKIASVKALAALARAESSEVVAKAYGNQQTQFGPDYLIPRPFDPRLIIEIAPAVAKAAMDSGVATRPIADFDAYRQELSQFVWKTGFVMRPVFDQARADPRRVTYTDGEEERVLRGVQAALDEGLAKPILIGRRAVVQSRIDRLGLRLRLDENVELVDPERDDRYQEYWNDYYRLMARNGVSPDLARRVVRTRTTVIGAMMLRRGDTDAVICGTVGQYHTHLRHVREIIGKSDGVRELSALTLLVMPSGPVFIADTHVDPDPTVEDIVEIALLAADEVRRFGITPKIALVSHSNFGTSRYPSALKMREAAAILHRDYPDLEVDGEMHADAAIDAEVRKRIFPDSRLSGSANTLIMPSLDAGNIAYNLVKALGEGLITVGPMLLGTALPAHIVTPSITARGLLNMTALCVVDAQAHAARSGSLTGRSQQGTSMSDSQTQPAEDRDELEGLYGATEEVVLEIKKAIAENRPDAAAALIKPLHAADLADLFEQLSNEERTTLVNAARQRHRSGVLQLPRRDGPRRRHRRARYRAARDRRQRAGHGRRDRPDRGPGRKRTGRAAAGDSA